jgi:hypothetical protein
MGYAKHATGALIQKIGIQALRMEKTYAVGKFNSLGDRFVILKLGSLNLLAELQPGNQTSIALDDVVCEIATKCDSRDGTDDVMGAAPDFAEKIHVFRKSQAALPRQQK